ncbi:TetR/AcrR family transcriptional regulator [Spongisporangium articulatum]|uniref:TetR/AcrR family transcriptional regulator n=1 Tax=Spongisporangium articulatum TaxID=3362603 RepID=A0ABW8AR31_9ACTN
MARGDMPGEPGSRLTRAQLVRATRDCIVERGVGRTRVRDIAQRAGTSPGLISYYFGTLDAVLLAAFEFSDADYYRQFAVVEARHDDAISRLRGLVELALHADESVGYWAMWLELGVESRRRPDLMELRSRLTRSWVALIRRCVRLGQTQGSFGPGDDNDIALRLALLMEGMGMALLAPPGVVVGRSLPELWLSVAATELDCPRLATP